MIPAINIGFKHIHFGVAVDVLHGDFKQEAIKLWCWQRIGAHHIKGILCRYDKEQLIQLVSCVVNGNLLFTHGFQHRRLDFWRSPVYLVCQYDMGEERARAKVKSIGIRVKNRRTGDV